MGGTAHTAIDAHDDLRRALEHCRQQSLRLAQGLSDADATVQSMDDASPVKWHLAHTTWFFEEFVLATHVSGYVVFHPGFRYLFNSYYDAVGERHPRNRRGMLTRPSLDEVLAYRAHVDAALARAAWPEAARALIELGIHHEQQHQELLLTDLLYLFAQNPLRPIYRADLAPVIPSLTPALEWIEFPGGRVAIGYDGKRFAFDCETPRHDVLLGPYALASRLVTQGDWLDFMGAGGYETPRWWLSDGWATARREGWRAPLYWIKCEGRWRQMTLAGERDLELDAPVCHVSFYEADAYARWADARLPTEFEWEAAAVRQSNGHGVGTQREDGTVAASRLGPEGIAGHFADRARYRPDSIHASPQQPLRQLFGDVWEWTASPYLAYPGFRAAEGAVGEYNGKFMSGQYVLRGGSCVTPAGHVRATYRNFFYPHQRWQFTGLRLARDLS